MSTTFKLVFEFPTLETRNEFVTFLEETGEQDYFIWCEGDPEDDDLPMVGFKFVETWKESFKTAEEVTIKTEMLRRLVKSD